MRVGVARLDRLLCVRQLDAEFHPVVAIVGAFRKDGAERADEPRQAFTIVLQPRGKGLLDVSRGGVWRVVLRAAMARQDVAAFARDAGVDVDPFNAAVGRDGEPDFHRRVRGHDRPLATRSTASNPRIESRRSTTAPTMLSGVDAPAVSPTVTGRFGSQPSVIVGPPPRGA
jgi:hypothetical protein